MRILHATSELFPYSKTGGLADMVDGLARALAGHRHQVGIVTPLYRGIRDRFPDLKPLGLRMELPLGQGSLRAEVWTLQPADHLTVYFIDQPEFYDRAGIYQEHHHDYPDNAARFIFFSKCVAHLGRHLPWSPELIQVHDWQAGLVPIFVRHQQRFEGWAEPPRTILTIHNLAFQGIFPPHFYSLTNLPWDYFNAEGVEYYGQMNCLKAGLVFADFITTVSPRYAREITTPEFGCGLDGVLRQRHDALTGILNGVDYNEWKTVANPHLKHSFAPNRLLGKGLLKSAVQKEFGLPARRTVPLFGTVSRLSEQKGMDIALGALEELLAVPMQFILLGSGPAHFVRAFADLASRYPDQVAVRFGFDQALSHRIEAGADFFVMPSHFEPCGLNQMYSLRYATIPIVRATGGLDDSVTDITEDLATADGIKFSEYSASALAKALRKALVLFEHRALLRHYRRNAMRADFSWERTCLEYVRLYQKVLGSDRL